MKKMIISLCSPLKKISKSYFYAKFEKPNQYTPIAYIKKSKYVSNEEYNAMINYLKAYPDAS